MVFLVILNQKKIQVVSLSVKIFFFKKQNINYGRNFVVLTIVQQLSAVPFAKATASTAMARKKVKAVPILMAFMTMVCSNDCEVSNLEPKK